MSSLQSALTRNPTSPEISNFLSTRSGRQMVQLLQSMQDPAAQAALTTALLFAKPVLPGRVTASDKCAEKTKKALNAFVGFRCYYIVIPVFKPWPMKKLSGLIGALWDCDPNKSLWSLMTKAWSTIRDQVGKDKAPLDHFFSIICPYLNIPSPEEYLQRLGWNFFIDRNGAPAISRDQDDLPHPSEVGAEATALSVEDIIDYCQDMGYAQGYVADQNLASSTFLGHTASMRQRLAVKKQRRAQRQVARDTGMAAEVQEQWLNAAIADGFRIPDNRNEMHSFARECDSADQAFYNNLESALTDQEMITDDDAVKQSQDTAFNFNEDPFRVGANHGATLPVFDGLIN